MISLNLGGAGHPRAVRRLTGKKVLIPALLGIAALALATPPVGFVVNSALAKGVITSNINENLQITRDLDGTVNPWGTEIQAHGATDFYMHHLTLAPGGYSGWHTHPGVLIGTVTAGSIDFYDENCQKKTVNTGDVYFETGKVHGIHNAASVNADIWISYLIKHNMPRRLEASAPACAVTTPIP